MTYLKEQIAWIHQRTHEGKVFSVGYDTSSLSNNSSINILIKTLTNTPHITIAGVMGGDGLMEVFEDVTYSVIGTALTPFNHNRSSNRTTTVTFHHTPTITSTGTRLDGNRYIPGGVGGHAVGSGGVQWEQEIIFKANSNYLVRLTNVSGQSSRAEMHIIYYEPGV
jgi:hypothetical protein